MPSFGILDHERFSARVPRVEDLAVERMISESVEAVLFPAEIPTDSGAELLPPALMAMSPPYARIELRRHHDSAWGPFAIAVLSIAGRAAEQAVAYATGGFCDNDQVIDYLRLHYGARLKRAAISLERRYYGIEGRIASEGRLVFDALLERPEPVAAAPPALSVPLLHLAKFEGQLWLIEEQREFGAGASERGGLLVRTFEPEAFGEARAVFRRPMPAAYIKAGYAFPRVRALIDPSQPAMLGTRIVE